MPDQKPRRSEARGQIRNQKSEIMNQRSEFETRQELCSKFGSGRSEGGKSDLMRLCMGLIIFIN